ncbi:MAG TPA: hypothetical protein V6C76_08755 [Drouetiella sp.]
MDAFFKCLLAGVLSLLPCSGVTNAGHLPSDKAVADLFSAHRQQFEDGVISAVIDEEPAADVSKHLDSTVPLPEDLRSLGVKSLQISGDQIIFKLASSGTRCKQLVFEAGAFQKESESVQNADKAVKYSRINDNWAVTESANSPG